MAQPQQRRGGGAAGGGRRRPRPWLLLIACASGGWSRAAGLGLRSSGAGGGADGAGAAAVVARDNDAAPFLAAFVIAMDPAKYGAVKQKLTAAGFGDRVSQSWGFNAHNSTQLEAARALLKEVGHDKSLVWHLRGKASACSHVSPSKPLEWRDLLKGMSSMIPVQSSLDDLFKSGQRNNHPACSNSTMKTIAASAAHVRVWKNLADRLQLASQNHPADDPKDGWYLILEDDVEFCPGWVSRLREELLQAPADADVLKLSWVGRWRNESSASPFLEAPADPYEGLTTDWMRQLLGKFFKPHHGVRKEVMRGNTLKTFSLSIFFGGGQAYLIRRSSLPRMMERLNGTRFDFADATIMLLGKTYVWRRVMAVEDGVRNQELEEEAKSTATSLKKWEARMAKQVAVEEKRRHQDSGKPQRKGKGASSATLVGEGPSARAALGSSHVAVPMCNKEPEDPVPARRKYRNKVKH